MTDKTNSTHNSNSSNDNPGSQNGISDAAPKVCKHLMKPRKMIAFLRGPVELQNETIPTISKGFLHIPNCIHEERRVMRSIGEFIAEDNQRGIKSEALIFYGVVGFG